MSSNLTLKEKLELYNKGSYFLPIPPVPTCYWLKKDWINYIDSCGKWITNS